MNPYYINEQTTKLHELITELYEGFFDDNGDVVQDNDYITAGLTLQRIIACCDEILLDIKQE